MRFNFAAVMAFRIAVATSLAFAIPMRGPLQRHLHVAVAPEPQDPPCVTVPRVVWSRALDALIVVGSGRCHESWRGTLESRVRAQVI